MSSLPDWVDKAILPAVIAAIGYVGKLLFDTINSERQKRREERASLVELRSLLLASKKTFIAQRNLALKLAHGLHATASYDAGLEKALSRAYPQFSPEQLELHSVIRGYSEHALKRTNEALLAWLRKDAFFRGYQGKNATRKSLSRYLLLLDAHLVLWLAKCDAWLPGKPAHALVYLDDEQGHGVGFPHGIDDCVNELLTLRLESIEEARGALDASSVQRERMAMQKAHGHGEVHVAHDAKAEAPFTGDVAPSANAGTPN